MTLKERIKAFVLEQGNQVGAGAELAAILNDIVDSIPGEYTLPPASAQTLGGIKVGENLSITEQGVLSASGGGSGALIVEGTAEEGSFVPNEGQPSKEDVIEAFCNGTLVLWDITDNTDNLHIASPVDKYDFDSEELSCGTYSW